MKKTKEEALKTRNKILKSSLSVFLAKGYSETTLEQIAKRSKVTRGAIYWHFKNKKEILDILGKGQFNRLTEKINEIQGQDSSALDKLDEILRINVTALYDLKEFRDYIELTWFNVEKSQDKSLYQSKIEITELFYKVILKLIKQAQDQDEIRKDMDYNLIALNFINLINGLFRSYFMLQSHFKDRSMAMASLDQYLDLIKK